MSGNNEDIERDYADAAERAASGMRTPEENAADEYYEPKIAALRQRVSDLEAERDNFRELALGYHGALLSMASSDCIRCAPIAGAVGFTSGPK